VPGEPGEAEPEVPTPKVTPAATLAPTPQTTPEVALTQEATATPAPDTGWIEGYVQGIADQWLAKEIYSGIDVAVAADDLRACLTDRVVNLGFSQDGAKAECPAWLFEPSLTPEPTATPTPTPEPEPTETPTPEGQQVTANGVFTDLNPYAVVGDNNIWLKFDRRGGPVTGGSHLRYEQSMDYCGETDSWETKGDSFEGTYSPDTKELTGTAQWTYEYVVWSLEGEEATCVRQRTGDTITVGWHATFENGVVIGYVQSYEFELTVQG
jgi:hypothetical protein